MSKDTKIEFNRESKILQFDCTVIAMWSYDELKDQIIKTANWKDYYMLLITTGTWSNIMETQFVPTSYFMNTDKNMRSILYVKNAQIEVYKHSETEIAVVCANLYSQQTLAIYGVGSIV